MVEKLEFPRLSKNDIIAALRVIAVLIPSIIAIIEALKGLNPGPENEVKK